MSIKPTNIPKYHLRKSADSAGNISRHCKLGELTENIRTFALPNQQIYTLRMNFEYDSWNRIQRMTYPDGEVVRYAYNKGGMLKSVSGGKNGVAYRYIDSIRYTEFELKDAVWYGNGARATYDYDVLQRLSHLRSACADGTMQDIDYSYDEVGNIGDIVNHAGMLPTGLGGTYGSQFTYDNLYRLTYADGNWQGNNSLYYETSMEYEKNGRISRKVLYADTWLDGNYATENYDNEYYYANSSQPNTLSYINDNPDQYFEWDLKGNMVFHYNGYSDYNRSLCWDEQNRLLGVKDDKQRLSYYLYDANGDRTDKFTGEYAAQNQSGQWHYYYLLNCPTLYASPYLVTNKKGYTKHYYAESERITTQLGKYRFAVVDSCVAGDSLAPIKLQNAAQAFPTDSFPTPAPMLGYLHSLTNHPNTASTLYFYHPDHLGSASWITNIYGRTIQHLYYLPWGEDFVNQKTTSFSSMYTFSAKEKDTETGYSYFGARYYSSDLSIWLSVDPMAAKYPSTSPYAYCRNNPIVLFDPNGMFDDWVMDKNGVIYWDENAKDQSTTKFGEQYLGRAGQRNYGTAVVNYKSDGSWSFMDPVEISFNTNTSASVTAAASSGTLANISKKNTGWVCGNVNSLNGIGFYTSNAGGMVYEAAKSSEKISKAADEFVAVNMMGKVAKTAKWLGNIGEGINVSVAFFTMINNPSGYNKAKFAITMVEAGSNFLNLAVPGLGTAVSIGISLIDANGGFDGLYNKFDK